jgi:hypothetical protein
MKINELVGQFHIWTTNEERKMLERLNYPCYINSFPEHEQFVIEGLIRKSLVIKIGHTNPKVIANEFQTSS